MNTRTLAEVVIVLAVIGLLLEIAAGNTWLVIAAGAVAGLWLVSRAR